jgi:hypothetical protein
LTFVGEQRQDKAQTEFQRRKTPVRQSSPAATRAPINSVQGVLQLQRSIGNQAVSRLFAGGVLQAKLHVGPAGDSYEREADEVANEVMRNLASVTLSQEDSLVRRSAVEGVVGLESGPVGADTEAGIQRHRGSGSPLPAPLRRSMEGSFGADFGGVRVHTGPSADGLNRSLQSRAFTVGGDIFFARDQYQPHSRAGQQLLAHELTHTVQQGAVHRSATPAADTIQRVSVSSNNAGDWDNLATGTASGGVNGVIFASAADGSRVVVKGLTEAPQRVMLAQELMEEMGVATTTTRPIAVSAPLGRIILRELGALGGRLTTAGNAHGAAITAKVAAWQGFQTLLLMEPAAVKNFSELATQGPGLPAPTGVLLGGARGVLAADIAQHVTYWRNLLGTQAMWDSFGRILYVDQFLGNEDRFENMKIQNIFIEPTTYKAVALDNDTMAADYISTITEIDAVTSPLNPQTMIYNMSPADYIRQTIEGGWMYSNTALQARAMATLDLISGTSILLGGKINQTVTQFLTTLQAGVAAGNSPNEVAANQVLTSVLANTGGALAQAQNQMMLGAFAARHDLQGLFHTKLKGQSRFQNLFTKQVKDYAKGYDKKSEMLYNYLALEIRFAYLEERAGHKDHNTALGAVQGQYGKQVAKMSRTAKTEKTVDPQTFATNERLVKIK